MANKHAYSESSDNELVDLACHADRNAMDALLKRYMAKTLVLIHRYVDESADAWDIAQEACVKIYQSINNFRHGSKFQTWHYRIVMNCIHNFYRQNRLTVNLVASNMEDFEMSLEVANKEDPMDILLAEELLTELFEGFSNMSSEFSEAIILYELKGLSYEAIAQKLNCPVGTVRSRISRARTAIEDLIRQHS